MKPEGDGILKMTRSMAAKAAPVSVRPGCYTNLAGEQRRVVLVIDDGRTKVGFDDESGRQYTTIQAFRAWMRKSCREGKRMSKQQDLHGKAIKRRTACEEDA